MIGDDIVTMAEHGPHSKWFYDDINRNTREHSWPRKAYKIYEEKYNAWMEQNIYYMSKIEKNPTAKSAKKEAERKILEGLQKERDEALENLKIAVNEYWDRENKIIEEILPKEFTEKIIALAYQYDFPEGIDLTWPFGAPASGKKPEYIKKLKGSIPFPDLIEYRAAANFLREYFIKIPTRVFKDDEDLLKYMEKVGISEEKRIELGARFQYAIKRYGKLHEIINSIIYLSISYITRNFPPISRDRKI